MKTCPWCRAQVKPSDSACKGCGRNLERNSGKQPDSTSLAMDILLKAAGACGVDTSSPLNTIQSLHRIAKDLNSRQKWTEATTADASTEDFWQPASASRFDEEKVNEIAARLVQNTNDLISRQADRYGSIGKDALIRYTQRWLDRKR